jgi:hypothetical protein
MKKRAKSSQQNKLIHFWRNTFGLQGFGISLLLVIGGCVLVSPIFLNSGLWNFPFMIERDFYCEVNLSSDMRRLYIALTR